MKRTFHRPRRLLPAMGLFCAAVYASTTYGGVRSPDGEVTFRTAEALARAGTFAVAEELELWPGFGLAPGRGGGRYSVFGPLPSLLLVPFVPVGDLLNASGWYEGRYLPVSHYAGEGIRHILKGTEPPDRAPHALRTFASLYNVLISTLAVLAFFRVARRLSGDPSAAAAGSLLFAFATPLWPYSGTFFSEPLTMLCLLLALEPLLVLEETAEPPARRLALAGLWSGLAVASHVTALLFLPFFAYYLVARLRAKGSAFVLRALAAYLAGLALPLALLGLYNGLRFGGPLETGRFVDPALSQTGLYGRWVAPWTGLAGYLWSPGKGFFFYAPLTLAGVASWPRLHRRHRQLSHALAGAALFRVVFLACRSDWHGGWSVGPRLLVPLVPLLLLPLVGEISELRGTGRHRMLAVGAVLAFAASTQQLYLVLGEPFSFYRMVDLMARAQGRSFDLAFDTAYAPLLHSLDGLCGPYVLGSLPLSLGAIWLLGSAALGTVFLAAYPILLPPPATGTMD